MDNPGSLLRPEAADQSADPDTYFLTFDLVTVGGKFWVRLA